MHDFLDFLIEQGMKNRMKNSLVTIVLAVFLGTSFDASAYAQALPRALSAEALMSDCEKEAERFNYPYYYCDCKEQGRAFQFGLDIEVADTMWFSASMDQLKQGMSAYWFSNCTVGIEVYALCSSKEPAFSMVVGRNQMREKDVAEINKKLEEMGKMADIMSQFIPRIRIYPMNGGSGRVLVFPYNIGPHSTCEDVLPIINGMTYVSSHDYDVYALNPSTMIQNRLMFVQWKQKKDSTCHIYITRKTCDGDKVADFIAKDSTKLFFPDTALINDAKKSGDTLFFHFEHNGNFPGRILFRMNPKWETDTIDSTFCHGGAIVLPDTVLKETTVYGPDTMWLASDTVGIFTYNITVIPADTLHDTLRLRHTQLPTMYQKQFYVANFGDYETLLHRDGQCDIRVFLHVVNIGDTAYITNEQTVCVGKTINIGGVVYDHDTVVVFGQWKKDTWQITSNVLLFEAPVAEYDTVYIKIEELPYTYPLNGQIYDAFGDYQIQIHHSGECDRLIYLTLSEIPQTALNDVYFKRDKPVKFVVDGHLYIYNRGKIIGILGK